MTTTSPPPTAGSAAADPRTGSGTPRFVRERPPLLADTGARIPAIDGLRAVAVAVVVAYHVAPSWVPAGFLGVSLFFTLSGFLITRLLLAEHTETGGIALRSFWTRRFRRLTPAAVVTLGVVTTVWVIAGWMTRFISGDVLASLAQVANWRFLATGTTYGVSTDASPVLHFWSLAIEEQFYLAYPLLVWVVVRRAARPARALGLSLVALLAASLVYTWSHEGEPLTIYFSTFSRAGEVLIGALVAVITWRARQPRARWLLGAIGAVALTFFLAVTVTTRLTDRIWAHGGLTAIAVVSALALVGVTQSGPFQRALAWRPLAEIGVVSYGIYLFHWPILVALRTTPLSATTIAVTTIGASLVLAWLSLKLLERPIRMGRTHGRRPILIGLPVMAAIAVLALWGGSRSETPTFEFVTEKGVVDPPSSADATPLVPPVTSPGAVAPPTPTATSPLAVSVFGDSTAAQLRLALAGTDPRIDVRTGWSDVGCALSRGGPVKGSYDTDEGWPYEMERCDWTGRWPDTVRATGASTVIIYGGFWDTVPRQNAELWDGWKTIEEPVVADHVRSEMVALADALHEAGARTVTWLTLAPNTKIDDETNVRRSELYNGILAEAAAQRPQILKVIDIAGWFSAQPSSLRPDGVHVSVETGQEVVRAYFADQLLSASSAGSAESPSPSPPPA